MPSFTPTYSLPYPGLTDPPNVPTDIKNLATATETALAAKADASVICSVTRSTVLSIPNSAFTTPVAWDAVVNGRNGGVWSAANPTRLTVPAGKGGLYSVVAGVAFATNATGLRQLIIQVNGTILKRTLGPLPNNGTSYYTEVSVARELDLLAGDYVELVPWQTSGAALNIIAQDGVPFAVFRRVSV